VFDLCTCAWIDQPLVSIVPAHEIGRATFLAPDGDHLTNPVGIAHSAPQNSDPITHICLHGHLPTSNCIRPSWYAEHATPNPLDRNLSNTSKFTREG